MFSTVNCFVAISPLNLVTNASPHSLGCFFGIAFVTDLQIDVQFVGPRSLGG
jgi:hypothetical protein